MWFLDICTLKDWAEATQLCTKEFFSDILVRLHSVACVQALAESRVPLLTFLFDVLNLQFVTYRKFPRQVFISWLAFLVISSSYHRFVIV